MSDEQFNCLSTKLSSREPVKISLSMKNKNDSKVYIYRLLQLTQNLFQHGTYTTL